MLGLSGFPRLSFVLAIAPLTALLWSSGCTCGSGPYEGDYFDGDRPGSIKGVNFVESEKGDPKVVGCADGQREGFADFAKHPRVAGCVGTWEGSKSLRDAPTGKACGDDGAKCAVPADLCSPGWHVCGNGGKPADLSERAAAKDCDNAGPGRFNAAMSHSPTDEINPCPKITQATVLPCVTAGLGSEPVCCGADCLAGKCKDAVWPGKTQISRGTTEGCGSVTSERNGGVMCCYDGTDNPSAAAVAADAVPAADTTPAAEAGTPPGEADAKDDDAKPDDAKPDDAKPDDAKPDDAKADAKDEGAAAKRDANANTKKADAAKKAPSATKPATPPAAEPEQAG